MTAEEKAEKALAQAEKRRLSVEKRKNDVPMMVTAWLVGVNMDLRKAPECRCLSIIDLTLVIQYFEHKQIESLLCVWYILLYAFVLLLYYNVV